MGESEKGEWEWGTYPAGDHVSGDFLPTIGHDATHGIRRRGVVHAQRLADNSLEIRHPERGRDGDVFLRGEAGADLLLEFLHRLREAEQVVGRSREGGGRELAAGHQHGQEVHVELVAGDAFALGRAVFGLDEVADDRTDDVRPSGSQVAFFESPGDHVDTQFQVPLSDSRRHLHKGPGDDLIERVIPTQAAPDGAEFGAQEEAHDPGVLVIALETVE